jgi:hypothetical protein
VLSLNALLKRGALKTQLETARGGGEKYRARRHHPEPAVLPTSTPQEGAREQALTVSVHVSPLAKALLKSLADRSPKTARQLADDAGWTLGKTHYHLHALTRSGAVAAVESAARSVHQAYVPGPRFDRHLQAHAEDESA